MSNYDKGIWFLLCVFDIFSKYACVVPFIDIKGIEITSAYKKTLDGSGSAQNKIWVDKSVKS